MVSITGKSELPHQGRLQPNSCRRLTSARCPTSPTVPPRQLLPFQLSLALFHAALPPFVCRLAAALPGCWLRRPSGGGAGPDEHGAHAHNRGDALARVPQPHLRAPVPVHGLRQPRRLHPRVSQQHRLQSLLGGHHPAATDERKVGRRALSQRLKLATPRTLASLPRTPYGSLLPLRAVRLPRALHGLPREA